MQKRCFHNFQLAYSELVAYDANANITSLQRYGMKNDKSFGLIDDLSIEHNGNQISSVSDAVDENLDYEGAFDFADGDDKNIECAYNGNGALTMDLNKGIDNIEYDLLGNPIKLTIDNNIKRIEYVYAADGRRLKTKHSYITYVTKPRLHREIFSDSTEYVGNLILKNGKPSMYQFSGGYYSFDGDNKPECHYYIADYQGNNRMVVNARTNEVEQTTHYYPYGGIIGNLSSNQESQKYKYSGKEFDRTYGLDLYDFHARLFNPALPVFDRPDPLAEDFTWLTPYNYCAGNPVNCVDPDGKKVVFNTYKGQNIELEKQFNQAREYLQSIGASEYLDRIVNDENFVVMISLPTQTGRNEYKNRKEGLGQGNWNEGIIYWDPTIAKETDNGYIMSPVEGLNHEANHAVNDLGGNEKQHEQYVKNSKVTDGDPWRSKEEKQVCKNENVLAQKMGKLDDCHQTTRTKYYADDKKYRVSSITSSSTDNPIVK